MPHTRGLLNHISCTFDVPNSFRCLSFYNNSGLGQEAFLFKLAEKSQEFRSLEDKWFYDTVNCFFVR